MSLNYKDITSKQLQGHPRLPDVSVQGDPEDVEAL